MKIAFGLTKVEQCDIDIGVVESNASDAEGVGVEKVEVAGDRAPNGVKKEKEKENENGGEAEEQRTDVGLTRLRLLYAWLRGDDDETFEEFLLTPFVGVLDQVRFISPLCLVRFRIH